MLNYLKKFAVDIFPSVAATVIGAYIVNHYIVSKPATDAPAAAATGGVWKPISVPSAFCKPYPKLIRPAPCSFQMTRNAPSRRLPKQPGRATLPL